MKKYDTYKKVEVNGVETIPTHWKAIKLRWVCDQIFTGRTPVYSVETNDLLVFGQRNNQKWGIDFAGIKYADSDFFNSRKEDEFLKYGDVLLNTLGGGSVGRIGFYDVKDSRIITDGHVMIMRGKNISTQRYLYYFLSSQQKELEDAAIGSTNQAFLTTTQMNQWKVVVPPLSEQQAIANYLDEQTAKIDKSINLLELQKADLQAYRKAIISETVTKGLNPNAKLKDSGIQWIGQIPEEWSVVKMKYCFEDIYSGDSIRAEELDEEGKYPVYGGGAIISHANKYNVCAGDIIIGRVGANCGCVTYLTQNAWATDNALVVKSAIDSRYLFHQLIAADLNSLNSSNAQPLITASKVKDVKFACPKSISGQKEIAEYIDKKTSDIDTAIERINAQITELQAYRTALISEAVTGKIDVRP